VPLHPQRDSVLARVSQSAQSLGAGLAPDDAERFDAFVKATLAQVRTVAMAAWAPATAAQALLDAWRFVQAADAAGPNVTVKAADGGVVVLSVMADQPFIVDTLRLALRARGATTVGGVHVILRVDRAAGVRIAGEGAGRAESVVRFEVAGIDPAQAGAVEAELAERLAIAQAMCADFDTMTRAVETLAGRAADAGEEGAEAAEFLRWLLHDNFVFIGMTGPEGALGADRRAGTALWGTPKSVSGPQVVTLRKSSSDAPVHRAGRADAIHVRLPSGETVVRGMFTRRALTQPCRSLPILRKVLANVLADTRQRPNSYRYRGLANIFDSLPTEWLFSASTDAVRQVLDQVFDAEQDQAARVLVNQQDGGGTTYALVAIPERRYSDALRSRILDRLQELTGASYTDSGLFAGRFETALLHVFQTGTRTLSAGDIERLQAFVRDATTSWAERAATTLTARFGDRTPALLASYATAFPAEYAATVSADDAAEDIAGLEAARSDGRTRARLHADGQDVILRVYESADILLTDLLPVLDDFGLVISDQHAVPVAARGEAPQQIDLFRVARVPGVSREELLARGDRLVAGLEAVFRKDIGSDPFNRLALRANLRWQEVDLVRAYIGYARQLGLRHPIARVQEILLNQAECVAATVALFHARFDPDLTGDRTAAVSAAEGVLRDALLRIKTNDEDLVMRTLANLVESTLRTNFYRDDRVGHYISFKIDHARVKSMPAPRMMVEIYVHHREVEGVHLRGGKVARGGLRYSDRADFRTEVLGLVATQMVKNVVIVPEGSKGGFYCKYTIDDAAERRRKGDELYQWFIRGLLDVTDNIVGGSVVRPPRVVAHDGDDPYLVVAADKGTAHLSDTANKLSRAYGFWLDDAFASGGSNGYDHKEVGITARGGWVLVKRLFHEMGMDADTDTFTAFGIGDCGGDVFGNGVIETPTMKLLAAFNHVHIFLDPNPDAAASHAERLRLFKAVKGWDAYDPTKISKGGGVYDRKAKTIPLSPEVKAMLGTLADELTPNQVIQHILRMSVDLFWNGGIGTYVRASHETNADANDPPNDDLRIAANELRCKVIGEGGNLGFTAAARIEYALGGGRCNTDFVDNSGGVDTSDHEVNLKILLNPMVAAGRMTMEERNTFIRSLTDEVADAVLADNDANGRLISVDQVRSKRDPFPFGRAVDWLCHRGNVGRAFLALPGDEDVKRRAETGTGFTRPELAVVQAHVKMHVFKMLKADDAANVPGFEDILMSYFPKAVQDRFATDIRAHMLAKDIGMTVLLTQVATDAGATFFPLMMDLTGQSAGKVAGAWVRAMSLTGATALRPTPSAKSARSSRNEAAYSAWMLVSDALTELVAGWLAPGGAGGADEDPKAFQAALDALAKTRTRADAQAAAMLVASLERGGLPADVAERMVVVGMASLASEVCAVAKARGEDITTAAVRLQAVGHASHLLATLKAIAARRGAGRWDPVALGILRLRYQALLREVAIRTEIGPELKLGVEAASAALSAGALRDVARITEQVVGDAPDVASLLVGEQQIRAALA
jgi:glutamate dehydrogenase